MKTANLQRSKVSDLICLAYLVQKNRVKKAKIFMTKPNLTITFLSTSKTKCKAKLKTKVHHYKA